MGACGVGNHPIHLWALLAGKGEFFTGYSMGVVVNHGYGDGNHGNGEGNGWGSRGKDSGGGHNYGWGGGHGNERGGGPDS